MEQFELRHLSYFQNKNIFVGGHGPLRFRMEPKKDTILVSAWKNERCFECQEELAQTEVPMTDAGLLQAVEWLKAQL